MNLDGMLKDLYRRLNFPKDANAPTATRLTAFLNEAHRQILSKPGMERLRDDVITFASVASQARYTVPPDIARIKAITERTNLRRLQFLPLDQLRRLDPGLTATGTPDYWIPIGYQAVSMQPSAATGIWAVSSSASDTSPIVRVDSVRTGGYTATATATLTGTSRVQIGSLTDHIEVTKFYLHAPSVGSVSLYDAASSGNELARLEPGKLYGRWQGIQLYPTPTAAVTYYVDYTRVVADLTNPTDEPLLPEDFHWLLILGALKREYEKSNDTTYRQVAQEETDGLKALRNWVLYPPDYDATPGVRPIGDSNLGPWFPRGTW